MSKDFQKQIIEFNSNAFKEAEQKYTKNLEVRNEIVKEVKSILKTNSVDEDKLFKDALSYVYNELKVSYKNKILIELSGEKIAFLLDLNLSKLQNLIDSYKDIKTPIQDDFCITTSNEIENNRLQIAKDVCLMLNKLKDITSLKSMPLQNGLNNIVRFDQFKQCYIENFYFVKNG